MINFDLPNVPEAYVHRIGRTGRAGASGRALSFCEEEERPYLRDIEKLIRKHVPYVAEHPYPSPLGVPKATDLSPRHAPRSAPKPGVSQARPGQRPAPRPQGHQHPHPDRAHQRDRPPRAHRDRPPR